MEYLITYQIAIPIKQRMELYIRVSAREILSGMRNWKNKMEKWIPARRIHVPKYTDMDLRF
jgi:hypothetical protein